MEPTRPGTALRLPRHHHYPAILFTHSQLITRNRRDFQDIDELSLLAICTVSISRPRLCKDASPPGLLSLDHPRGYVAWVLA